MLRDGKVQGALPGGGGVSGNGGACTRTSPCIGPRGGRYYLTPEGNKRYLPR